VEPASAPGVDEAAMSDAELAEKMQAEENARAPMANVGGVTGEASGGALGGSDFGNADAAYASLLQTMELQSATAGDEALPEEPRSYDDPVWGKYTPPEGGAKPHQVICFSMCPCCIGPYCSDQRKGVLKRIGKSASFIFGVIQLLLLVASFFARGIAPMAVNPMIGPWPDTL
jgi:hypothetical protein